MAAKGMELTFIPLAIINREKLVELVQEDIASEYEKWRFALIAYMIGYTPTIGAMERFVPEQGSFDHKSKR